MEIPEQFIYPLLWKYFVNYFEVSIVNFEWVNFDWILTAVFHRKLWALWENKIDLPYFGQNMGEGQMKTDASFQTVFHYHLRLNVVHKYVSSQNVC